MRYFPHTEEEIKEMLQLIGRDSLEDLFRSIPDNLKLYQKLKLPPALSELELRSEILKISKRNTSVRDCDSFLGGGAYHHYIPSPISQLINRGEFFTSYTPYQPEVSQGTLQALFEYQSMLCELTEMDVANASNYDLSTACAEALLMAERINKKKKALIARSVHPQYRKVMQTYLERFGFELIEINYLKDGSLDQNDFNEKFDDEVGAVLIQSPNFFGVIEDIVSWGKIIKDKDCLFIHAASEALSLASLSTAGEADCDIAIYEGQSFGVGLNFGGPFLGILTTKQDYIRQMPGRVVGETEDSHGKKGYVLTFSTREQHIRREKATSNICTNQGLCALMACIYLSLMGKEGLVNLANINLSRAHYAKNKLSAIDGVELYFEGPTFNEFVLKVPQAAQVGDLLREKNIFPGTRISRYYDELDDAVLVCVTEMNSKESIDRYAEELQNILKTI